MRADAHENVVGYYGPAVLIHFTTTMERANVLIIPRVSDAVLDRIAKTDPRVDIIDARGWFDGELRSTRPQSTVDRYLRDRK